MIQPYAGTATRRRELRQKLRNVLGTSRSEAPSLRQLAAAIVHLDNLVQYSTASQYRVRLVRNTNQGGIVEHPWTELKDKEMN